MTTITIPLAQGPNYISFPASSINNFRTIFTDSNMINDIGTDTLGNKLFHRYDPILNSYVLINIDMGIIEKGQGYYLYIASTSPHNIVYDGIEYILTFDQFKSRIIKGWNLLGVGKDIIVPTSWCKILDPITNTSVTTLEPTKSYMVNYDDCTQPSSTSASDMLGLAVSSLMLIYLLKEFKVI
jgi:hypothetical protein